MTLGNDSFVLINLMHTRNNWCFNVITNGHGCLEIFKFALSQDRIFWSFSLYGLCCLWTAGRINTCGNNAMTTTVFLLFCFAVWGFVGFSSSFMCLVSVFSPLRVIGVAQWLSFHPGFFGLSQFLIKFVAESFVEYCTMRWWIGSCNTSIWIAYSTTIDWECMVFSTMSM